LHSLQETTPLGEGTSKFLHTSPATMFAVGLMKKTMAKGGLSNEIAIAYGIFAVGILSVWHVVANGEFSAILTMSVMCQALAFATLAIGCVSKTSMAGISANSLILEAMSLTCRLSSTTWLNGYLPVDASGDFIFQASDFCSLFLVFWLIYRLLVTQRHTYQEDADSLPVLPFALVCLVLAAILHADMNSRPLFDALWMAGTLTGSISVLPQLWLITRNGGIIEASMSHYIAMMAVSRGLSGIFMWHARFDVTCAQYFESVNHAIWAILAAHALNIVLLADFGYHYIKAIAQNGLCATIELPVVDMV